MEKVGSYFVRVYNNSHNSNEFVSKIRENVILDYYSNEQLIEVWEAIDEMYDSMLSINIE